MNNIKKCITLGLVTILTASLCACGKAENLTEINIGTWWPQYYDSSNTDIADSEDWKTNQVPEGGEDTPDKVVGRQICELKWANRDKIEEKYGLKYYWKNLTYEGVKESINTSIIAGSPDCEIYLVDAYIGIPAQTNGLALDLKTVLPKDADILTDQKVLKYVDIGDGKACIIQKVSAASSVEATYPLGFNVQMLEKNGLEDPRALYERGEWTWDKFNEYCKVLTQDTDGDGKIDQYGYCGYENETFENLMMSNGADVAKGQTENLSSAATGEALQEMYDLYNTYNVCYPYDFDGSPSDTMRKQYANNNIGFFPIAAWIESETSDYSWGEKKGQIDFDIAYVRWPVGPSGNKDTNPGKNGLTDGEFYIIPVGCKNPEEVYNFFYDYWNWYDGDTSIRDSKETLNWWYGVIGRSDEYRDANFNVMMDCGNHTTFDLWNSLNIPYDMKGLIKGEITPAQFQETYKLQVQDGLDQFYK